MSKTEVVMNNFTPSCFGHGVKLSVIVLVPRYFSSGAALPQKNTWSKTIKSDLHNDLKKDGMQLLLFKHPCYLLI